MAPPWFIRDKKVGAAFLADLAAKPAFLPNSSVFSSDVQGSTKPRLQGNGVIDPDSSGDALTPLNPDFWPPSATGAGPSRAAWSEFLMRVLQPQPATNEVADAHTAYFTWADMAIPAAVVVAQTFKEDGTLTDHFLMCVNFPTAFRRGHHVVNPWSITHFPGSNLPVPSGALFPLAGTIQADTRTRDFDSDDKTGMVFCFADEDLYRALLAPAVISENAKSAMIDEAEAAPDFATLWRTHGHMVSSANAASFIPTAGYDPSTAGSDDRLVVLPRFFPLPCPSPIPPGIIGRMDAFRTVAKLTEVLEYFSPDSADLMEKWSGVCPLFHEWLNATFCSPLDFASTWWSRDWISGALKLTNNYSGWTPDFDPTPFRTQDAVRLFQTQDLTVDWRDHLDRLLSSTKCGDPNSTMGKKLRCYLHRGNDQAFSNPTAPLGQVSFELAGEQPFVRPPNVKDWASKYGFRRFITPSPTIPLVVQGYVIVVVDVRSTKHFDSSPLLTIMQAEALIQAPDDDDDDDDEDEARLIPQTPLALRLQASLSRRNTIPAVSRNRSSPKSLINITSTPVRPIQRTTVVTNTMAPPPVPQRHLEHDLFRGRSFLPPSPTRGSLPQPPLLRNPFSLLKGSAFPASVPGSQYQSAQFRHTTGLPFPHMEPVACPPRIPVANSATTTTIAPSSDYLSWSLTPPMDTRQPLGFWFYSAILVTYQAQYQGFYVGSSRAVEPLCRLFAPRLWDAYCIHFLSARSSADAIQWLQGLATERSLGTYLFAPIDPRYDQMPIKMVDAFRTGSWRTIDTIHKPEDLVSTFSAFSILSWLPNADRISCRFPADGINFATSTKLLRNFIWSVAVAVAGGMSLQDQQCTQFYTPLLVALDSLLRAITTCNSHGIKLEQVWDKDTDSKHRLSYRMIRDIDLIFTCYRLLIRPFERPVIFFECSTDSGQQTCDHSLWPYYDESYPVDFLSQSSESPNLMQALNTLQASFALDWRTYLGYKGDCLHAPPEFLCVSDMPSSKRPAGEGAATPASAKKLKTATDTGKDKPIHKSPAALLRFVSSLPADRKTTATVAALLSKQRSLIPKTQGTVDNIPFRNNAPFCFPYLIEGLGCTCSSIGKKSRYAHPDLDGSWSKSHFHGFVALLADDSVKAVLELTAKGHDFMA